MTGDEDIEGLAAEYALGSLDAAERKQVEARCRTDAALAQAVTAWQRRLGPLSDREPGLEPPPHLFGAILRTIQAQGQRPVTLAEVVPLRPRPRRSRALTAGAAALAACLALVVGAVLYLQPGMPRALVAELHRAGPTADEGTRPSTPAFLVNIDLEARQLTIRPVSARPRPGRSYQLWVMHGLAAPTSLGIILQTEPTSLAWPSTYGPGDFMDATLAVSLEPDGGSPTGAPMDSIIFAGRLIPAQAPAAQGQPR